MHDFDIACGARRGCSQERGRRGGGGAGHYQAQEVDDAHVMRQGALGVSDGQRRADDLVKREHCQQVDPEHEPEVRTRGGQTGAVRRRGRGRGTVGGRLGEWKRMCIFMLAHAPTASYMLQETDDPDIQIPMKHGAAPKSAHSVKLGVLCCRIACFVSCRVQNVAPQLTPTPHPYPPQTDT